MRMFGDIAGSARARPADECVCPQTVEEHMQLSFSHIMKHWKRNPNAPGQAKVPGSRNVLLRFYPPQSALGRCSILCFAHIVAD